MLGGGATSTIAPSLEDSHTEEVAGWHERELVADLGVRAGFIWRTERQLSQLLNANQPLELGQLVPPAARNCATARVTHRGEVLLVGVHGANAVMASVLSYLLLAWEALQRQCAAFHSVGLPTRGLLDRFCQFQYIPRMRSKTIETRLRTTKDGRLNLSVDVEVSDVDVAVVLTVTPVTAEAALDHNGWPEGFFDRVAGSMPELRRGPQGDFEERLPLE
jgi:hypothetical protein